MLSSSLEDYLEAIFHIVGEKQAARAKDIAKRLKVNNSSVTGALRSLAEKGMINYAPYDVITLTTKGQKLAEDVVRRYQTIAMIVWSSNCPRFGPELNVLVATNSRLPLISAGIRGMPRASLPLVSGS